MLPELQWRLWGKRKKSGKVNVQWSFCQPWIPKPAGSCCHLTAPLVTREKASCWWPHWPLKRHKCRNCFNQSVCLENGSQGSPLLLKISPLSPILPPTFHHLPYTMCSPYFCCSSPSELQSISWFNTWESQQLWRMGWEGVGCGGWVSTALQQKLLETLIPLEMHGKTFTHWKAMLVP